MQVRLRMRRMYPAEKRFHATERGRSTTWMTQRSPGAALCPT